MPDIPLKPPAPKLKLAPVRPINKGTCYDISGQIRTLARKIERGELGNVQHVVVMVQAEPVPGGPTIHGMFVVGEGDDRDTLYALEAGRIYTMTKRP